MPRYIPLRVASETIRVRRLSPAQKFILDIYVLEPMAAEGLLDDADPDVLRDIAAARGGRTFVEMSRAAWIAAREVADAVEYDYLQNIAGGDDPEMWEDSPLASDRFAIRQARKVIPGLIAKIDAALAASEPAAFVPPPEPVASPTREHPDRIYVGTTWAGTDWYVYDGDWDKAATMHKRLTRGLAHWHEMQQR